MKDPLHDLLMEWRPAAPDMESMRRGVRQRILASESRSAASVVWRPAWALAVWAVAILVGAGIGARLSDRSLERAYLDSVNPYRHLP